MSTEDDFFIALGPGVGFACNGANILVGGYMTGVNYGVWAQGLDRGPMFGAQFGSVGIVGTVRDGAGVIGTTDNRFGVFGQAGEAGEPTGPAGVCGTSRQQIGVIGSSSENVAVFGQANKSIGVYGTSNESWGIVAQSGSTAAQQMERAAVLATSSQRIAVAAVSDTAVAVHAHSGPPHNFGFFRTGTVTATSSGNGIGVSAVSSQRDAVRGVSVGSHGVTGYSSANYGVYGLSFAPPAANTTPPQVPAGVYGQSFGGGFGVLGEATRTGAGVTGTGSGDGIGVFGYHPNGVAGYFDGNVFLTSDLHVAGQIFAGVKDAIVPFPDGSKRVLHCMESPEHWFEDFGSARLKRGRATVKLGADFAKVVTLNGYRVFLTPEGDCKGLYVRSKRGASFEVRELQGGTSSVAFSYRIVAKRKDIKRHTRFAKIDLPAAMPVGKAPAARGRKTARLPSAMRAMFAALEKEARKKPR
jgi:hypothetical protein